MNGKVQAICPVCKSSDSSVFWTESIDAEYRTVPDHFKYYRCAHCDVLFLYPLPIDRLSVIYPPNYNAFSLEKTLANEIKNWLDQRFFRKLTRGVRGESLTALDIGGGHGHLLSLLQKADQRVKKTTIIDIDAAAESIARERGHHFVCQRIEDVSLKEKFDIVLMFNLIEHVADPVQALEKVLEMLSPNGVVVLKTPNYNSLDEKIFRNYNWSGLHCPRHWTLFTKASLTVVAQKVGFAVVKFNYTQGAPFWAMSLINWLVAKGVTQLNVNQPANTHNWFSPLAMVFAAFDFARLPFMPTSQMFLILGRRR